VLVGDERIMPEAIAALVVLCSALLDGIVLDGQIGRAPEMQPPGMETSHSPSMCNEGMSAEAVEVVVSMCA
jgi:hypothetical protein